MNRREFVELSSMSIASLLLSGCGIFSSETDKNIPEASAGQKAEKALAYQVQDQSAPEVFLAHKVDAAAIVRTYEAVGRKLTGKVGIKLTFETPGGPYLNPQLLKPLRDRLDGTFMDSNGFSAPRNTTEGHLQTARDHGFAAVGPIDILDADGELDLPVTGGKYLKYHRTGSHFSQYDSVLSIVKFKAHHIRDYGGTLKNLSICLASISGKAIIHSAGRNESSYHPAGMEEFLESMADAAKAALDYRQNRWVFLNVLCDLNPDDDCADAKPLPDIGVLASLDPVALDQAAVDLTFGAAPSETVRAQWEEKHNTRLLGYAEERGIGQRHYRLTEIA